MHPGYEVTDEIDLKTSYLLTRENSLENACHVLENIKQLSSLCLDDQTNNEKISSLHQYDDRLVKLETLQLKDMVSWLRL